MLQTSFELPTVFVSFSCLSLPPSLSPLSPFSPPNLSPPPWPSLYPLSLSPSLPLPLPLPLAPSLSLCPSGLETASFSVTDVIYESPLQKLQLIAYFSRQSTHWEQNVMRRNYTVSTHICVDTCNNIRPCEPQFRRCLAWFRRTITIEWWPSFFFICHISNGKSYGLTRHISLLRINKLRQIAPIQILFPNENFVAYRHLRLTTATVWHHITSAWRGLFNIVYVCVSQTVKFLYI